MSDDTPDVVKRRRVQPSAAGEQRKERRVTPKVFPGDMIEYGLTYQINVERGLSVWLKTGVTSAVQPGESSDEAWVRVKRFVDKRMQELIDEHKQS